MSTVSVVISWKRDVETGKNMWKVFKMNTWAWSSGLISSWWDNKKYSNQVWGHRKQIKFIAETYYYACPETQLSAATVYL